MNHSSSAASAHESHSVSVHFLCCYALTAQHKHGMPQLLMIYIMAGTIMSSVTRMPPVNRAALGEVSFCSKACALFMMAM